MTLHQCGGLHDITSYTNILALHHSTQWCFEAGIPPQCRKECLPLCHLCFFTLHQTNNPEAKEGLLVPLLQYPLIVGGADRHSDTPHGSFTLVLRSCSLYSLSNCKIDDFSALIPTFPLTTGLLPDFSGHEILPETGVDQSETNPV